MRNDKNSLLTTDHGCFENRPKWIFDGLSYLLYYIIYIKKRVY